MYAAFKSYDILCIEHDEATRDALVECLRQFFHRVYSANSCEKGYDLYLAHKPHVILSDIHVKNNASKKMIEKIRKNDFSTIIIVSNANYDEHFLQGLINLQINHYMFKSTHQDNLLLSIKKAFGDRLLENITFSKELYFDMKKRELIYNENTIFLRKREKEFLLLLFRNKNRTTSYFEIEEALWADREMSKNALKTFINELRKKLPFNFIENIMQEGYRLNLKNA